MLTRFRQSQGWFIYLFFGVIVFVFAFSFGPGSDGCSSQPLQTVALSINEDEISVDQYISQIERPISRYDENQRPFFRKTLIDALVDAKLLVQEAKERGLWVSDDAVRKQLKEMHDEEFLAKYRENLANINLTPAAYEASIREQLLAQKMRQLIIDAVQISEAEARDIYAQEKDRVRYEVVRFPIDQNIAFEPDASAITTAIAEQTDALQAIYTTEPNLFKTKEKRKLSQLYAAIDPSATTEQESEAKQQLQSALDALHEGTSFIELLQKQAPPDTGEIAEVAQASGTLGWKQRDELPITLAHAAFSLAKGAHSQEPVRSPSGYHLLYVEDIESPTLPEFEAIKEQVAKVYLTRNFAHKTAQQQAQHLIDALSAGANIEDLSWTREEQQKARTESNPLAPELPIRESSGWIQRSTRYLSFLGEATAQTDAIFELTQENPILSSPIQTANTLMVVRRLEREKPDFTQFQTDKESFIENERADKANVMLTELLKKLKSEANIIYNRSVIAEEDLPTL